MKESPATIHDACQRIKANMTNKKAISGGKVSFQERQFTVAEESRVVGLEKKVVDLVKTLQKPTPRPVSTLMFQINVLILEKNA